MKSLVSILCSLLLMSHDARAAWLYARPIVIDGGQVPSNRTSMPIVLKGPFTHLATGGGKVTDTTNAYDVAISTDAACVTIIPSYRLVRGVSTGDVDFWFAPATTTHTTNTLLWQCYGNSSYTGNHSTPVGVWDANYKSVYLFPDGSALSGVDAIGNFTLTNHGATADTSGPMGSAAVFAGGYLDNASFTLGGSGDLTVSCLVYSTNFAQTAMLVEKEPVNGDWELYLTGSAVGLRGGSSSNQATEANPSNSAWHYIIGTITGTVGTIYIDGVTGTPGAVIAINNTTDVLNLGRYSGFGGGFPFGGKLSVCAVSNIVRPIDQGKVENTNLAAGSTLVTLGAEVSLGGSSPPHRMRVVTH